MATAEFTRVPEVGRVTLVAPVEVKVIELAPEVTRLEPSARVRVAEVVGAVKVSLLTEVAVATPKVGVTKVGEVENTRLVEVVPVVPVAEAR